MTRSILRPFVLGGGLFWSALIVSLPASEALVEQLGAPKVRLRDEAEARLAAMPGALPELQRAAESSPSEEVRLRARRIVKLLRRAAWVAREPLRGHLVSPSTRLRTLVVAPDQSAFLSRGADGVVVWNATTLQPSGKWGPSPEAWHDWQVNGPLTTLAVSPDNQRFVCTGDFGEIEVRTLNGELVLRFANHDPLRATDDALTRTLWAASFFPDGRRLATGDRDGFVRVWDAGTGKLLQSTNIDGVVRTLAVSPDGSTIAVSRDTPTSPDFVWLWDVASQTWTSQVALEDRANLFVFSKDGSKLLTGCGGGRVRLWTHTQGRLSDESTLGPYGTWAFCAIFAPDESSIFVGCRDPHAMIKQIDLATGTVLWDSGPGEIEHEGLGLLSGPRLVATGSDGRLYVWDKFGTAP